MYTISMHDYPGYSTILKFGYFCIHMVLLKNHIQNQHTCLPIIHLKQISSFIFNFHQFVYFIINNNNSKYSYEKYINPKFGISTLVYLY